LVLREFTWLAWPAVEGNLAARSSIAGTVTYGNYFTMHGDGSYRIVLTISQTEAAKSLMLEFSYDHWTR